MTRHFALLAALILCSFTHRDALEHDFIERQQDWTKLRLCSNLPVVVDFTSPFAISQHISNKVFYKLRSRRRLFSRSSSSVCGLHRMFPVGHQICISAAQSGSVLLLTSGLEGDGGEKGGGGGGGGGGGVWTQKRE